MRQPTSKGCSRLSSTPKPPPEPGREWVFLCSVSPSRVRSWQSTVSSPDAILGGGPPSVSPPALSDAPFPAHRLQGPPGSRAAPQRAAAGALFGDGTFRALTQLRSRGGADAARHPQHRLWAAPGSPPLEATYVRRGPHPFAPPPPGYGKAPAPGLPAPGTARRAPGADGGTGRALPGRMAADGSHLLRDGAGTARRGPPREGGAAARRGLWETWAVLTGQRRAPRARSQHRERAAAPRGVTQSPELQKGGIVSGGRLGRMDRYFLHVPL